MHELQAVLPGPLAPADPWQASTPAVPPPLELLHPTSIAMVAIAVLVTNARAVMGILLWAARAGCLAAKVRA
jgi:hypothetical protein